MAATGTNLDNTTPGGHISTAYKSLKAVVQETLQRSKTNSVVLAPVKDGDASSFNYELEELEKVVRDRVRRLKTAVNEGEAVVIGKAQHAEQLIESLRANIAAWEAKLSEKEDTVRKKDSASKKMEESFTGKIHDLQSEVKKKEEFLETRANEVRDLASKLDAQVKHITQLDQALQQAKAEAASQAQRAENLAETSTPRIAALEAQLRNTEEIVRGKGSTIKKLEQDLTAKIQDLENQVINQEKLLADRDRQVSDLKSQLKVLTNGIKEMSSIFGQAEALTAIEARDIGTVLRAGQLKDDEEKSVTPRFKGSNVTFNKTHVPQETVSAEFFDEVTHELTKIVGPLASAIVHKDVAALGESMEKFPKTRVTEFIEIVSKEILDNKVRISFRARFTLWPLRGVPVDES